jgi:hypothetical protein
MPSALVFGRLPLAFAAAVHLSGGFAIRSSLARGPSRLS